MSFEISLGLLIIHLLHISGHNGELEVKIDTFNKSFSSADVVVHDPGGLEMKQVIACSPNTLNISCPEDHTIEIINGNFGRFTITLCNGKRAQNWSVNCYLDEAVVFMREECNGRSGCFIQSGAFSIDRDPCPGTERYLEAHYRCAPNQGTVTLSDYHPHVKLQTMIKLP